MRQDEKVDFPGLAATMEWSCWGTIPLFAVFQPMKNKARPVNNYRELNAFAECHTGVEMVAVCGEKIRKWRQWRGELRVGILVEVSNREA